MGKDLIFSPVHGPGNEALLCWAVYNIYTLSRIVPVL